MKPEVTARSKKSLLLISILGISLIALVVYVGISNPLPPKSPGGAVSLDDQTRVQTFKDETDFKEYLAYESSVDMAQGFLSRTAIGAEFDVTNEAVPSEMAPPDRVSTTNVQIAGIDEPDIVKTDGKNIFVSKENYFLGRMPVEPFSDSVDSSLIIPEMISPDTSIINAYPLAELGVESTLDVAGDLLLSNGVLIVQNYNSLTAFDTKDTTNPTKLWDMAFTENSSITASRLVNNTLYVVTQTSINHSSPCPLTLTSSASNDQALTIPCGRIYHPITPIAVDVTYTALAINPENGETKKSTSFVGSTSYGSIAFSDDRLFLTYGFQESQFDFLRDFFETSTTDLLPDSFYRKLSNLASYDISESSKVSELYRAFDSYMQSLNSDEAQEIQSSLETRAQSYLSDNKRSIERTGIVSISVPDLEVTATGGVPGSIINQFSLDYYNGSLRIATTTHASWMMFGSGESVNDLYILDSSLTTIGSLLDLGLTEQIYAVRFVGNTGYLVTFRQIDPFYVLDLSDPTNPKKTGELKIPGFSSYLHPLSDQYILGIGQISPSTTEGDLPSDAESQGDTKSEVIRPINFAPQVKVSLFDVSVPESPVEKSTYLLDESWSEVSSSHHAFLLDDKHSVFFVPTTGGGYVIGYTDGELALKTKVSGINARRALYINDYLYIIGDSELIVVDETTWTQVSKLSF